MFVTLRDDRTGKYIQQLEADDSPLVHSEAAVILGVMPRSLLNVEAALKELGAVKILAQIDPSEEVSRPMAGLMLRPYMDGERVINFLATRLIRDYIL